MERYGEAFVELLGQTGRQQHSDADRQQLLSLLQAGMTPEQVARQLHLNPTEVLHQIAAAVDRDGIPLAQLLELNADDRVQIETALLHHQDAGIRDLKQVASSLDNAFAPSLLRCVRMELQRQQRL